jgi:glycosyltransferase involved in cell wall biosynthesis
MKVALAHDFLRHGGAERMVEQVKLLWPDAPIYTILDEGNPEYADWEKRTSWLQRFVPAKRYRWPLPLFPGIIDRWEIEAGIDLLLSSSVSFTKNLRAPEGAKHLCYLHSPMRFAYPWQQDEFLAHYPAVIRPLLRAMCGPIRDWDKRHTDRADLIVSNSQFTADKVMELYGRESPVIFEPVGTKRFAAAMDTPVEDYFLIAIRLETYKRVDVIVRAATELGIPMKICGKGGAMKELQAMAGPNVEFLGHVPYEELPPLVAGCRAFLFSAIEDFGISPVEAMAAGRPVIAYADGGVLETVDEGRTGLFYRERTPESLIETFKTFRDQDFDPQEISAHAEQFSEESFREQILAAAEELVGKKN